MFLRSVLAHVNTRRGFCPSKAYVVSCKTSDIGSLLALFLVVSYDRLLKGCYDILTCLSLCELGPVQERRYLT